MHTLASGRLRALLVAFAAFASAGAVGLALSPVTAARPNARTVARTAQDPGSFIGDLNTITTVASAVPTSGPATGDQNPYGVAVVPTTIGDLQRGDVLVSNFNNSMNQQGTGSSIVEISPGGAQNVFAVVPQPTSTPAVGLTTALVALKRGLVVVGSLPAPGGASSAMQSGALTILGPTGQVVRTITAPDINGPWDMTAVDHGRTVVLFVTNVLNGTVAANGGVAVGGTVVRLVLSLPQGGVPRVLSNQVIATGFPERTDPNALVIGPTGVGIGSNGTLYVADSLGNRIAAIPDAMTRTRILHDGGRTVSVGEALNDPLGLMIAPNGDIVTADGADGNLVETTPGGLQVAVNDVVPNGGGDLFGLALTPDQRGIYFVNDSGSGPGANSLQLATP